MSDDLEPDDEPDVEPDKELHQHRQATGAELRVDFAAVESELDALESDTMAKLKATLEAHRDLLLRKYQRAPDTNKFLRGLTKLPPLAITTAVSIFLRSAFDVGGAHLRAELAQEPQVKTMEGGVDFTPKAAVEFLRTKALLIKDSIGSTLLQDIRRVLTTSLANGVPLQETMGKLKAVYEPWLGDATAIRGDAQVAAHRLEAIVRTESTAAFNQGRLIEARKPALVKFMRGMRYSAILDTRTTEVCQHLDGMIFTMDDPNLDRLRPPRHVNCLTGDANIAAAGVAATSVRRYDGNLFVITTAAGNQISCTPNHPILTPNGWVPARAVNEIGYVIRAVDSERRGVSNLDGENMPTVLHEIAEAFGDSGKMLSVPVPTTAEDFHGDGMNGEVAVIRAYRHLWDRMQANTFNQLDGRPFNLRYPRKRAPISLRALHFFLHRYFTAFCGNMRRADLVSALGLGHAFPFDAFRFATVSQFNPSGFKAWPNDDIRNVKDSGEFFNAFTGSVFADQPFNVNVDNAGPRGNTSLGHSSIDNVATDVQLGRDLMAGKSGVVELDKIANIDVNSFHGNIYNLETVGGWYVANGIITHNCRSVLVPITIFDEIDEADIATPSQSARGGELSGQGFY